MKPVYIDCSSTMHRVLEEWGQSDALTIHEGDPTTAELGSLLADAEIVLNGHTLMDAAVLTAAPRLRSIVFLGTGASSYVDTETAYRLNIRVRTVRGYGDRTVAEHAFGLLLAAARNTAAMDRAIRAGAWSPLEGIELRGRTLGIVGCGGIGSEMARIAAGFGMRVLAWSRSGLPAGVPAEAVGLDDLLAVADAVSLHLALVPETRGLINSNRIARMKAGAIIVNTARGAIIDEAALIAALQSRHISHAALDVFATEPLPPGHALARLDNVTLTSHAGWKSGAASHRLLEIALTLAADDARMIAAGLPLA